jgi:hypothetical protein
MAFCNKSENISGKEFSFPPTSAITLLFRPIWALKTHVDIISLEFKGQIGKVTKVMVKF